jgi:hypothetical protein
MKKKFNSKLSLKKNEIVSLTNQDLMTIEGGKTVMISCGQSCPEGCPTNQQGCWTFQCTIVVGCE